MHARNWQSWICTTSKGAQLHYFSMQMHKVSAFDKLMVTLQFALEFLHCKAQQCSSRWRNCKAQWCSRVVCFRQRVMDQQIHIFRYTVHCIQFCWYEAVLVDSMSFKRHGSRGRHRVDTWSDFCTASLVDNVEKCLRNVTPWSAVERLRTRHAHSARTNCRQLWVCVWSWVTTAIDKTRTRLKESADEC